MRYQTPLLSLLGCVALLCVVVPITAELNDGEDIEHFCFPAKHKDTRHSCECSNVSTPPWGMRAVRIDCSYKSFRDTDFANEALPLYMDTLDVSWNALDIVPQLSSDSLRLLNMMHNNISVVSARNFAQLPALRELYLSWNSIQLLDVNAFAELAHLQVLDLSHNNLHALAFQSFAPMIILESLSLSWNRQLNQTEGIQELNFYTTYGVSKQLRTLKLEACSLSNVVLDVEAPLEKLDLRRNLLQQVPETLPRSLQQLDLSDNLFTSFGPAHSARFAGVQELLFEDMPLLEMIEANAFVPLQSLRRASFQNSRRLSTCHGHAFGANTTRMPALNALIFRGTSLRTLNATLSPIFHQLSELDLNGMPLHCDCELIWVQGLAIETQGRCFKPSRLRGTLLTQANVKDFSCNGWPRWIYGLIILGLIILCSAGIYLIVMGLRPHRGVTMRRKVGSGSPYAPVTIEPNRQENY